MTQGLGLEYTHLLRTRAYLASLPLGIASYPECRSKVAVWRNIVRRTNTSNLPERVPTELRELLDLPLPEGAWFPAVHSFAGHLMLRDCLFTSDEAMYDHFRHVDRMLLAGPLYRVLFSLTSPHMVVHASDRRFATLFQGLELSTARVDARSVEVCLDYPPRLCPPLVGRLFLIAFEVAVELAGGADVQGRVLAVKATGSRYALSWS